MFKISTRVEGDKAYILIVRGGWLGTESVELFGEGVALAFAARLDLAEGKMYPECARAFADWVRENATELGASIETRHPLRAGWPETRPEYWEAVAQEIANQLDYVPVPLPRWA